jgi:hypothetical protein
MTRGAIVAVALFCTVEVGGALVGIHEIRAVAPSTADERL